MIHKFACLLKKIIPCWVILGPFWVIFGHIWATLGQFGSFLAISWTNFNFFCGSVAVTELAFRMYVNDKDAGQHSQFLLCFVQQDLLISWRVIMNFQEVINQFEGRGVWKVKQGVEMEKLAWFISPSKGKGGKYVDERRRSPYSLLSRPWERPPATRRPPPPES